MTDDEEYEQCNRCSKDAVPERMMDISLSDEWRVCEACVTYLEEEIIYNSWRHRYTEEIHERAVDLLSERDEIYCTISDYERATIVVHTPYVSADVIVDFCRHFGFRMTDFRPLWHHESDWPCAADHGDAFEVVLRYLPDSPMPALPEAKFTPNRIEDLEESDKQF